MTAFPMEGGNNFLIKGIRANRYPMEKGKVIYIPYTKNRIIPNISKT